MSKLVYTHPNTKALRRFFRRIQITEAGCWQWTGALTNNGHASFCWNYVNTSAHRIAYWWFVERPTPVHVIDHLCRNRACVNPTHLEAVTPSQNSKRGLSGDLRTVCKRGHALIAGNIFLQRNYAFVHRTCLKCRRIREDRRRAKRRAARLAAA